MENELRKEGARPPAYRERQQVVGKERAGASCSEGTGAAWYV